MLTGPSRADTAVRIDSELNIQYCLYSVVYAVVLAGHCCTISKDRVL